MIIHCINKIKKIMIISIDAHNTPDKIQKFIPKDNS